MIKVLEISADLDGGGVDRLLYDYCSRMADRIQFDFIVSSKYEGILEQPLKNLGCKIFHVAEMRKNLRLYLQQLDKIFREGKYDIVHSHVGYKSFFVLRYAKKYGVKVRIAHSHIAYLPETKEEQYERLISASLTKYLATDLFACGRDAAKWMWHKVCYVMNNAINTKSFVFSQEKRDDLRNELGIGNKFVVGNVGRLSYQKNHEFLIMVFSEVKKMREESVLLLVGRGELEGDVKVQVKSLGLEKDVIFLGVRNDVHDLLNAMDVFVLPSRFEGLPVVMVEVQANGLPIVASNTITDEIKLADNVYYMPLSESPVAWAQHIIACDGKRIRNGVDILVQNGYDIDVEAKKMQKKYLELYNKAAQVEYNCKLED